MRGLLLFVVIGNILVFGALAFFVFVPKNIGVRTDPAGAAVFYNGNMMCPTTPCELSLNRVFSKQLVIEHDDYKPYFLDLPALGDGWKAISENTVKLTPFVNQEDVSRALEACKAEREKAVDPDNVDARACYRIAPIMPRWAERSGHCNMEFDVSQTGTPFNIRVKNCTEYIFAGPSITAIKSWVYLPAKKDSTFVVREGVENKMSFRLTNELGTLIPEPLAPYAKQDAE